MSITMPNVASRDGPLQHLRLQIAAPGSLLSRVETATGQQKPIAALLKFADDVCSVEQHRTRQRLLWSRESGRKPLPTRQQSSRDLQLPQVPLSSREYVPGEATLPNNGSVQHPVGQTLQLATTASRTSTAPSFSSFSARQRRGPQIEIEEASCTWPSVARRRRGNVRDTYGDSNRNSWVRTAPKIQAPSRVPSALTRMAAECAHAGLFIIPDTSSASPDAKIPELNIESPMIAHKTNPPGTPTPSTSSRSKADAADDKYSAPFDMNSGLPPSMGFDTPMNRPPIRRRSFIPFSPCASGHSDTSDGGMSGVPFYLRRLSYSREAREDMAKLTNERALQHLEEIVEEKVVADSKGRETRQQLKERHAQQLSQLQELTRTLQQLQPQELPPAVADSMAMLRQMMGGSTLATKKLEGQPAKVEESTTTSNEVADEKPPVAESNGGARASSGSLPGGQHGNEVVEFLDMSLPPLCGPINTANVASGSRQPNEQTCSLAKSCSTRKKKSRQTLAGSFTANGAESDSDSSSESSEFAASSLGIFKRTLSNKSLRAPKGSFRSDKLRSTWKSKINFVKLMGRMSSHKIDREEEFDEEQEQAAGRCGFTRNDMVRLADEHNLPLEKALRARRMFLRHDTESKGQIGPEEVQTVLRDMYKNLHPNVDSIPQSLSTVPSRWAPSRFPELLRLLAQTAFDESSLVPVEQMQTRELAKKWDVPVTEVEHLKEIFERVDVDKAGFLNLAKFKQALHEVLRTPKDVEVPSSRAMLFWKEVDTSRTGKVDFEQFFWWYQRGGF